MFLCSAMKCCDTWKSFEASYLIWFMKYIISTFILCRSNSSKNCTDSFNLFYLKYFKTFSRNDMTFRKLFRSCKKSKRVRISIKCIHPIKYLKTKVDITNIWFANIFIPAYVNIWKLTLLQRSLTESPSKKPVSTRYCIPQALWSHTQEISLGMDWIWIFGTGLILRYL